jgi:hypothetical protein
MAKTAKKASGKGRKTAGKSAAKAPKVAKKATKKAAAKAKPAPKKAAVKAKAKPAPKKAAAPAAKAKPAAPQAAAPAAAPAPMRLTQKPVVKAPAKPAPKPKAPKAAKPAPAAAPAPAPAAASAPEAPASTDIPGQPRRTLVQSSAAARVSAVKTETAPEPSKGLSVKGWAHSGGINPETSILRHLLNWHGVVAPHTGEPLSEALVLGLAGGLGGSYWVDEMFGWVAIRIGGRHNPHDMHGKFFENACQRLGVPTNRRESTSTKAGEAALRETIAMGQPGIVWVGLAGMPYFGLPREYAKGWVHTVLITGVDDSKGSVQVCDTAQRPLSCTLADLAYARAAITLLKNRVMTIGPPTGPIDFKKATTEGIKVCIEGLSNQPIANFGLSAFKKWADLVTDETDKKAWPAVMSQSGRMLASLVEAYESLEVKGTGGGLLRPLYADFLVEAAEITKKPSLLQASNAYREAGALWSKVADALLPEHLPTLKEARGIIDRRAKVFREQNESALTDIKGCHSKLNALRDADSKSPALKGDDLKAFLKEIETRIRVAYEAEVEAVQALKSAL